MIREFQTADTEQVMQIWLNGNEDAHPFISKKYWCSNFSMVQEQLLQAEVFVYEKDGIISRCCGKKKNEVVADRIACQGQ